MSAARFQLKPGPNGFTFYEILPNTVVHSKFTYLDRQGEDCRNIDPLQLGTLSALLGTAINEAIRQAGSSLVPRVTNKPEYFNDVDGRIVQVHMQCEAISPNTPPGTNPKTVVDLGKVPAATHAFHFDFSHNYQAELVAPWAEKLRSSPLV